MPTCYKLDTVDYPMKNYTERTYIHSYLNIIKIITILVTKLLLFATYGGHDLKWVSFFEFKFTPRICFKSSLR